MILLSVIVPTQCQSFVYKRERKLTSKKSPSVSYLQDFYRKLTWKDKDLQYSVAR